MARRNYQSKSSYKKRRDMEERKRNKVIRKFRKEWRIPSKGKKPD